MPWRGPEEKGEVPTLGWEIIDFLESCAVIPDGEFAGQPFRLSSVQREFVLNFYRIHPEVEPDLTKPSQAFVYSRGGQLVAPQKHGKGPFSAAMAIAEAYGPVLFAGWDAKGEPVGRPWATPWIQVTAVSEDQTANIWKSLLPMILLGDLRADIPDTGLTRINLPSGGTIEPVTASARSRLGQRITFCLEDEAHDWTKKNGGRRLADNQRRNLAGMGGRFLETGNAWDPAEHSVAQQTYEAKGTEVYRMMLEPGPGSIRNKRERMKVLKTLYASSWWVDPSRISAEIDDLLERGEVAQAERFFLNRIVPGEDRAFDARRWAELAKPKTQTTEGALITIGVDGARYFDAIAVIATDVASGYQWNLGIWERPPEAPDDYEHPFDEVDGVVTEAFRRWNVWRLYADPGSQYANISPLVDKWQGRWGNKRVIAWMMNQPKKTAYMLRAYVSAMMTGDLSHDGDQHFAAHIENARRKTIPQYDEDGVQMWVIQKESPRSPLKIDAAAAGGLSWEARSDAIASGKGRGSVYDARLREKQGAAVTVGRSAYDRRLAQRKRENSGV